MPKLHQFIGEVLPSYLVEVASALATFNEVLYMMGTLGLIVEVALRYEVVALLQVIKGRVEEADQLLGIVDGFLLSLALEIVGFAVLEDWGGVM